MDVKKFRVEHSSVGEGTGKVTVIEGINPDKIIFTGGGDVDNSKEENVVNFCVATVNE